MSHSAEHRFSWTELTLLGGACLLLTFAAFGRSLWQDFAPLDDHFLILDNLAIRGVTLENLRLIFTTYDPELYIPATLFTFQLNHLVSGLQPWSYHLLNLLLHAANALFVSIVLFRLSGARYLAAIAGLLFAVHPLHTEAVVWATGRKDLLSTLFILLTWVMYLKSHEGSRRAYVASLLFFTLALLSKAMAMTLPVILLLQSLLLERRPLSKKLIIELLPFLLLSGICFVIAAAGKERILASSPLIDTTLMACRSIWYYLPKLFVPTGQTIYHPHDGPISLTDSAFLWPLLYTVALLGGIVYAWKRSPHAAFGMLFFLITLGPTFFNFHKGELMYFAVDRYAYLPSVGILLLLIAVLQYGRIGRQMLLGGAAAVIPIFLLLSYLQTRTWDSAETLFAHALAVYPMSLPARIDLASVYLETGREQQAFELLLKGLEHGDSDLLRLNAGYVYARTGQLADAREQFERALALDPKNPEPLFAIGSLEEQTGNTAKATELYEEAVTMDESYVGARVALARLYIEASRNEDALQQLLESVRWNRNSREAHEELGNLLMKLGRKEEAAEHLRLAEELAK